MTILLKYSTNDGKTTITHLPSPSLRELIAKELAKIKASEVPVEHTAWHSTMSPQQRGRLL